VTFCRAILITTLGQVTTSNKSRTISERLIRDLALSPTGKNDLNPLLATYRYCTNINRIKLTSMEPHSPTSKLYAYPKCLNGNESRSICLSENCRSYPFYCAVCEEEICEIKHLHGSKIVSTGFREFMKKIQQFETPKPELLEVCEKYRSSLIKLKEDVNKFVER
jgi:hypothetical protein